MGAVPLSGESSSAKLSDFSLYLGLPQLLYSTGTFFCGSLFKTYEQLPTEEWGVCPYDGCPISIPLESLPASVLELTDKYVPSDCKLAEKWLEHYVVNAERVKNLYRTMFQAAYGGGPSTHVLSDNWSSLLLPARNAVVEDDSRLEVQAPSAAPAIATMERVMR
jgi:hypothetical protein